MFWRDLSQRIRKERLESAEAQQDAGEITQGSPALRALVVVAAITRRGTIRFVRHPGRINDLIAARSGQLPLGLMPVPSSACPELIEDLLRLP